MRKIYASKIGENGFKQVFFDFTWMESVEKIHKLFTDLDNNETK